jgi:hypothetical protein
MKNTTNVGVLVKKTAHIYLSSAHSNAFPGVFVNKVSCVTSIIRANAFHVLNVLVGPMNFSILVAQLVLIRAQLDLNHALNNVFPAVSVMMALYD